MSRLGRYPISIPNGVKVEYKQSLVNVSGPKGKLTEKIDSMVKVRLNDNELFVDRLVDDKNGRSKQGLYRSLIQNMIIGVSEGFRKELEVVGIGYRVNLKGKSLELHKLVIPIQFLSQYLKELRLSYLLLQELL